MRYRRSRNGRTNQAGATVHRLERRGPDPQRPTDRATGFTVEIATPAATQHGIHAAEGRLHTPIPER